MSFIAGDSRRVAAHDLTAMHKAGKALSDRLGALIEQEPKLAEIKILFDAIKLQMPSANFGARIPERAKQFEREQTENRKN